MKSRTVRKKGFTLIAALLMMVLLSGVAIGLMMMVNTETRVGGNDAQNNLSYHQAEGAVEHLSSDLANMYHNLQAPQVTDFTGLSANAPSNDPSVTYPDYSATPHTDASGNLEIDWGPIKSGPNAGLYAQILQVDLKATAQRATMGNEETSMMRTVEVALIPVFQFGAFSDSDLAFFTSPNLDFQGRIHTNGNLFLGAAAGYTVTFHDRVTTYGEVIRTALPNNLPATCSNCNDSGTVKILTASGGCDGSKTACRSMSTSEGSVKGTSLTGLTYNSGPPSWINISTGNTYYNSWILNGDNGGTNGTGVNKLSLPFIGGGAQPYEILRRPPAGELATSPIGASREYNLAEIRVLLASDPAELPGGATDADNIRLANYNNAGGQDYTKGVPITGTAYNTYFAEGSFGVPNPSTETGTVATLPADWPYVPVKDTSIVDPSNQAPILTNPKANPANTFAACSGNSGCAVTYPYYSAPTSSNTDTWSLLDGYLRVEAKDSSGNWFPVTREWLQLGFARGVNSPTAPGTNPVHPNAILLLQKPADRNSDGNPDMTGKASVCTASKNGSCTKYSYATPPEVQKDPVTGSPYFTDGTSNTTRNNWYPINFYDAREGEPRDFNPSSGSNYTDGSCTSEGIMNAVEIDVGNLKKWLQTSTNGQKVDTKSQNGYILYFSDRRGMLPNPNGTPVDPKNTKTGDSGLEDVINTDGSLEPQFTPAGSGSPEDVNENGVGDFFGTANLGLGFYGTSSGASHNANSDITAASPDNMFVRLSSCSANANNWVSGARHVLKLVDGSLGNLPTPGFTVASENPVYIQGNYNTNASDSTWSGSENNPDTHAAASIIGDAVSLLSNSWTDTESFKYPTTAVNRPATTTYYRTAISAGKNRTFPYLYTNNNFSFGTDGGLHNFLRFLESWNGDTLNYKGSLVSLYYSTYATGTFKCCTYSVYEPPTRNYIFDSLFSDYRKLPPGTPMFRDVEKLSYRQDFTARSN
jgi:hypothetical protein